MSGRTIARTWPGDSAPGAPRRYRRACRYDAFIPTALRDRRLSLTATTMGVVSEAEAAMGNLNAGARPALVPLARLLLRSESIASSRIEGMQLGVRGLARAEARLETGGRVGPTAAEVLANVGAMQLALDESAAASHFSADEIVSIHRRLMEHSPHPRIAGQIRTEQNWIGGNDYNPCGADFVPPPPEYVPDLMKDLCEAIEDDLLPPLVQAALVHAQFEAIHPFLDGNGRTGRALIHTVLRRRGLTPTYVPPISIVLSNARAGYVQGLTDYREGNVEAWVDRFAASSLAAADLAIAYLEAVEGLKDRWRELLVTSGGRPRADAVAWAIIDLLPGHPLITGPIAADLAGRSRPQVYKGLDLLEAAGVLRPLTRKRRNRIWEATGLLDLLEGLEAGERPGV